MGPPQQSENSWLAALPPSLSWLLVFLFLPAPLLGVEREDGQLRPNPCSVAHPALSWPLWLGRRLWLVFYEVVRLSALSKPQPLPQTSCDQQGKVIYADPKGHCGALLDLGGRGSSAEDIFFSLVPRWPSFILLLIYIMLLLLFSPLHVVSSDWAEQTAFLSWMARDREHITGCPGLPKRAQLVL